MYQLATSNIGKMEQGGIKTCTVSTDEGLNCSLVYRVLTTAGSDGGISNLNPLT